MGQVCYHGWEVMYEWSHRVSTAPLSGSAYCALYMYKYCYKGAARKERIDLG